MQYSRREKIAENSTPERKATHQTKFCLEQVCAAVVDFSCFAVSSFTIITQIIAGFNYIDLTVCVDGFVISSAAGYHHNENV